jgi:hypothetical protein
MPNCWLFIYVHIRLILTFLVKTECIFFLTRAEVPGVVGVRNVKWLGQITASRHSPVHGRFISIDRDLIFFRTWITWMEKKWPKKCPPSNPWALHALHVLVLYWKFILNSVKVALKLSLFVFPGEEAEGPWQRGIAYKGFSPMVKDDSHIINPWLWTALGHGPHVRYVEYVRIWKAST